MINYYRKITALFPNVLGKDIRKQLVLLKKKIKKDLKKLFLYLVSLEKFYGNYILIFSVLIFVILSLNLFFAINVLNSVLKNRVETLKARQYWRENIQKHPNAPDVFYNAAIYELKFGNKTEARIFLDKALFLDPLFKEAEDLKKKIK